MQPQSLRDAKTGRNVPIEEAGRAWDASFLQGGQPTRTDIDDISDLIEDALTLSAKARSVVEAIIGGSCGGPECGSAKDCPSGVLSRMGDCSRDARTQIAMASDELERLARSFGV